MPTYNKGDVLIVLYPFTDGVGRKPRPAAVVSSPRLNAVSLDVVVVLITTNIQGPPGIGDFDLVDWRSLGLLAPSRLRTSRVAAVELTKVRRHLGALVPEDFANLEQGLRDVFEL